MEKRCSLLHSTHIFSVALRHGEIEAKNALNLCRSICLYRIYIVQMEKKPNHKQVFEWTQINERIHNLMVSSSSSFLLVFLNTNRNKKSCVKYPSTFYATCVCVTMRLHEQNDQFSRRDFFPYLRINDSFRKKKKQIPREIAFQVKHVDLACKSEDKHKHPYIYFMYVCIMLTQLFYSVRRPCTPSM